MKLPESCSDAWPFLVPLSARNPHTLAALAAACAARLAEDPQFPLAGFHQALARRRDHHDHRLAVVAHDRAEVIRGLQAHADGRRVRGVISGQAPRDPGCGLVFVFAGMGPQWWGMGRELLRHSLVFRSAAEAVDNAFRQHADWSILAEFDQEEGESRLTLNMYAQPANLLVQVALAALWADWGIEPAAIVGHSTGEFAAAYVAGALSLHDAARVCFYCSRAQQRVVGQGKMMAVSLSPEAAVELIASYAGRVDLAAVNSPVSCVLAGEAAALGEIGAKLTARNVFNRLLTVEVAHHSFQIECLKQEMVAALSGVAPATPRVPMYSTAIGERLPNAPALDAAYWWRNVRQPVAFAAAAAALLGDGYTHFLEVGPHPALASAIEECAPPSSRPQILASLHRRQGEGTTLLESLGRLYTLGYNVVWERVGPPGAGAPFSPVQLPATPCNRQHRWQEAWRAGDHSEDELVFRGEASEALPVMRLASDKAPQRDHLVSGLDLGEVGLDALAQRGREEELLVRLWSEVLHVDRVGVGDDFFALGGDSLQAMQIASRAVQLGLPVGAHDILRHRTIAAAVKAKGIGTVAVPQGLIVGSAPTTPSQRWLVEQSLFACNHYNAAYLLVMAPWLDPDVLERAIAELLCHHDALRSRFPGSAGEQQIFLGMAGVSTLERIDLSHVPESSRAAAIEGVSREVQSSLDLSNGPVLRFVWMDLGAGNLPRLLMVFHHLLIDDFSIQILFEDLAKAYAQLPLPDKTTSFMHWAQRVANYARGEAQMELPYWLGLPWSRVRRLPVEEGDTRNEFRDAVAVQWWLPSEITDALMRRIAPAHYTSFHELLLTTVAFSIARWAEQDVVLINTFVHGRDSGFDGIDVTRTLGWFTSLVPRIFEVPPHASLAEVLARSVEERRRLPRGGLGHGILRYLGDPQTVAKLRALPEPQVSLNYTGRVDGYQDSARRLGVASAPESSGPAVSPSNRRAHSIAIAGRVVGRRLGVTLMYNKALARSRIEALRDRLVLDLTGLTATSQSHVGSTR